MSRFQAEQQASTMPSQSVKTRFDRYIWRKCWQTFSAGLISADLGDSRSGMMLELSGECAMRAAGKQRIY